VTWTGEPDDDGKEKQAFVNVTMAILSHKWKGVACFLE
jgi:hypothetical protein